MYILNGHNLGFFNPHPNSLSAREALEGIEINDRSKYISEIEP
jgi:hypothetical protein